MYTVTSVTDDDLNLRDEFENDGRKSIRCVKSEEGERLAREYDGLFIETSAKKGDNIIEAVIELTRLMRANEDLEVQNVGMQLKEMKEKSKLVECCTL
ncbi:hypothetical protein LSH36_255g04073 [Paralvinella palmiformis]|uniref:Uncharacterized protein n=1 Tax=Paralvinella palmiformis TaxID=53620 RepID=A0AAD9N5C3_9ANNE|nr:hypothetical protein LSH36_255g04073 [Paralvinella palmiformis]